jgi:DNA-binding transcriptional LysR family regulator
MDIQDIEIFARIAVVQNLSQVGTELGLTPGTISKRVQALEDELSVRLFERTTRSIRITDEGTRFLRHVERILLELEEAKAVVAEASSKPKGRIRVVASHSLARQFVTPAILSFLPAYPEIDVQIDFTERHVNLQEDGYDVAVFAGNPPDSTLIAKRLTTDRWVTVASPCYIARCGKPVSPDDLSRHTCLSFGDGWNWIFTQDGVETTTRITPRLRSDNKEILRQAAITGHGLMRTSVLHVADELKSGNLVCVLEDFDGNLSSGIWALYPGGKHLLPRVRVFLDFLAEWFRKSELGVSRNTNAPLQLANG